MYDNTRIPCSECIEVCKRRKDPAKRVPDCEKCGYVIILPENYLIYGLIEKYSGILINEGTIQPAGIKLILDIEDIPYEDITEVTQKIIVSLQASIQAMRKKL